MNKPFDTNTMNKDKVLLAFSGGLDTTFCAVWLKAEKNFSVHAVTINTGGFTPDELNQIEERALVAGCEQFEIADGTQDYYARCIRYLIAGNVLKNGTYPLSVSAERVIQAILLAEKAKQLDINVIAHGSTGAGNDQVRFDMLLEILLPGVNIITPVRDLKLSREEEIGYLKQYGVDLDFRKAAYSVNKGIWGTSVGGKETLTSHLPLPEEAWPTQISKSGNEILRLHFTKGELTGVNDLEFTDRVEAIHTVNTIAAPYGVGRDMHVGDTIIGIKGRVAFEAAAPLVIIKAHHLLEKHVLSKWQLYWKDQLATWYGNWLHEGQYFEPAMRDMEALFTSMQEQVTGTVEVLLQPYRFSVLGVSSQHDLMQAQEGKYGEMNDGWSGDDVKGFTKIFGNQVKTWYRLNKIEKEETVHE